MKRSIINGEEVGVRDKIICSIFQVSSIFHTLEGICGDSKIRILDRSHASGGPVKTYKPREGKDINGRGEKLFWSG